MTALGAHPRKQRSDPACAEPARRRERHMIVIHKVSETATTVTLAWTPVPCLGYVLYANGIRTRIIGVT